MSPRVGSIAAILRNDARRLTRDRFLLASALYLVGTSVAMRWVIPWAIRGLGARWGVELDPFAPLVVSYFVVVLAGVLVGVVGGFLLLESREDGSMRALLVTPVSMRAYLLAASGVMALAAAVLTVLEAYIIGVQLPRWPDVLAIAAVGGLSAPLPALFLASFAADKVEAFAQMKIVSFSALIPIGAYFVSLPTQAVAGLYPPYWSAKAWWLAAEGGPGALWWLLGGVLVSAASLVWLIRRFEAVVGVRARGRAGRSVTA